METFLIFIAAGSGILLVHSLLLLRFERSHARLAEWAFDHGYRLVDSRRQTRVFVPRREGQSAATAFEVVVEDDDLHRRSAVVQMDDQRLEAIDVTWKD